MKTSGVKAMVREVLEALPTPYTEHVIDDVFQVIESDPNFCHDITHYVMIWAKN
jgi:hypothetical protein